VNSRPKNQFEHQGNGDGRDCAFTLDHVESFALDALDSFDRGIVEHHLRWCESCQKEAASFERVVRNMHLVTQLGAPPPVSSRQELMRRIAAGGEDAPLARPQSSQLTRQAESASTAGSWTRYIPVAIIAPLALALLVVGVWVNSLQDDLSNRNLELTSQTHLNQSLANGGQVQLFSVEQSCPTCRGNGQVGVSESKGMGMVVGHDFDPSQQHDVWGVNDKGEKKMFCELEVDSAGAVMQMFTFPDAPSAFTDVYITDENGAMMYVSRGSSGTNESTPYERETPLPTT